MVGAVLAALMAAVVLLAAFVKGAIGFGFPALGTPLLSLVVDVKTAVVVLILPNIVMDGIQFARRGTPLATVRRFGILLVAGALGTVLGTRALVVLSPRAAQRACASTRRCWPRARRSRRPASSCAARYPAPAAPIGCV